MKEKVCCVLDTDEEYAVKLTEYFNNKGKLPYHAMAYTSLEALVEGRNKLDIIILISGIRLDNDMEQMVEADVLIYLGEDEEEGQICRYQSADRLMKAILEKISIERGDLKGGSEKILITGIYAPAYEYDKEYISLAVASEHGREKKVLYINLEEFSDVVQYLVNPGKSLSDALFYYLTSPDSSYARIISCTRSAQGYDYMYPVVCAEDIMDVSSKEIIDFLQLICRGGAYDEIIIEIGTLVRTPWDIMEICGEILVPKPQNINQKTRLDGFQNFLEKTGREYIASRVRIVDREAKV